MISKKTKYALKALEYLARHQARGPILISELSAKEGIPKKFLESILLELKNNGILQSKKGKQGGYFFGKNPSQVTLGQVVRILEGPLAPLPCASKTAYARCEECVDEKICGVRLIMKDVRDAIADVLDQTTFADMLVRIQEVKDLETQTPMFHI